MTVTIASFEINQSCDCPPLLVGHEKENHIRNHNTPITYWGVYLDDKFVYYTSSRELAEKIKLWIENVPDPKIKEPTDAEEVEMGTTVSATIKVLNKPNEVRSIMKNLARLIIKVLLTGLENIGTAEAYCLGIDLKEPQKK